MNDKAIETYCRDCEQPMISPFLNSLVSQKDEEDKVISYGLSSFGYDFRLDRNIKIVEGTKPEKDFFGIKDGEMVSIDQLIDPKNSPLFAEALLDSTLNYYIMPPHSYVLSNTVERICLPGNVTALFIGKSTYARSGIMINATPAEAGWQGHLTLEIANLTNSFVKIYFDEGICQGLFFESLEPCRTSYSARNGKYDNQERKPVESR